MSRKRTSYFDYSLLFLIIFMLAFGLLMLYSTSSYNAAIEHNDSAYYLKNQLQATILGLIAMGITIVIPYRFWGKIAIFLYGISIVSVLLVLTPIGMTVNGARRWLNLGFTSVQPAEIAKVALIIYAAALIANYRHKLNRVWSNIAYFLLA